MNDDTRHFENAGSNEILQVEYGPVKETKIEDQQSMM
jgi:hypothetical protein